jgi:HK97 family phage prohead protease
MNQSERRMAATVLEVRENADSLSLIGYASTFGQPYDMGWYIEDVDRAAFNRTLTRSPDVRMLVNHTDLPLARTTSGTLGLSADDTGLRVQADLDATDPDVQRLAPKMRRGDLNQMSFAFRVVADAWDWSDEMHPSRTLRELDLDNGDVSVVTYPANPNTSAALRDSGRLTYEALASALLDMESRGMTPEQVAAVLERAQRQLRGLDANEPMGSAMAADAPESESEADPAPEEPIQDDRASARKKARERRLALLG